MFFALSVSESVQAADGKASLIRIQTPTQDAVRQLLRGGFDVIESKEGHYSEVIAFEHDLMRLDSRGITYEVLIPDMTRFYLDRAKGWSSTGSLKIGDGTKLGYFSLDTIYLFLDSLQAAYPALISPKYSIGRTNMGRTQWMYKVSDNPETDEAEPEVLYTGLTHARELGGPTGLLYFIEWLMNSYAAGDPEAIYLVDNRELYFVPIVNPDGLAINDMAFPAGGGMWRKNARDNNGNDVFDENGDGVDINRNFDYRWGFDDVGSSANPAWDNYRGLSKASEPETQGLQNFVSGREFGLALNYHTYSELLIWPWGYLDTETGDSAKFRDLGDELTFYNKYLLGTTGETIGYEVNGDADDYMYGVHGILSMTPEIGTQNDGFWPEPSRVVPLAHQVLHMNKMLAWLGGAYLDVIDYEIYDDESNSANDGDGWLDPGETVSLVLHARNKGFGKGVTGITGTLNTNSPFVTLLDSTASFPDADLLTNTDNSASPYRIMINSSAIAGDTAEIIISWEGISGDAYFGEDTLRMVIGTPVVLFYDDAENGPKDWIATGNWGVSDIYSVSGGWAFDDSRYNTPASNSNTSMTLKDGIDLTEANGVFIRFKARWDIEHDADATLVEFSPDDGISWFPLSGSDTQIGLQPAGVPAYSGYRNRRWREQLFNATPYLGENPVSSKIRFVTIMDEGLEFDGFYADDIFIGMFTSADIDPVILAVPELSDTRDISDYVVSAIVSDEGSLDFVRLYYSLDDGEFNYVSMQNIDDFYYEGAVPGQSVGTHISYYVEAIDDSGNRSTIPESAPAASYEFYVDIITAVDAETQLPKEFALLQNYPNPFNPQTELRYELPEAADVRLTVYNLLGQLVSTVVESRQEAGYHRAVWYGRSNQGTSLSSGVYIYKLTAKGVNSSFEHVKKMVLLR